MYLYCMLMRFHYTVIYRCSELLQKYKQAPKKSLFGPAFNFWTSVDSCDFTHGPF